MANRASMREGPLADLFRATEEGLEPGDIHIAAKVEREETTVLVEPNEVETPDNDPQVVEVEPDPELVEPEAEVVEAEPETDEVEVVEKPAPKPKKRAKAKAKKRKQPKAKRAVEEEQTVDFKVKEEPGPVKEPRERLRKLISDPILPPAEKPRFGRTEPDPNHVIVPRSHNAVLRVVGVGGAGVNAVNRMVEAEIEGVEFIAMNTDLQSLEGSNADTTLHIGSELTRGLGAGADPRVGYRAAFDTQDEIKDVLKGSDMVFVTAGAGGGTGTGAAPVVAKLARDGGALTVGVCTKPFAFEGVRRAAQAEEGVSALSAEVDTLIVVPNEKLLTILERKTSMVDAFQVADDVLRQAVQGISDLVMLPGLINLDFADIRTTMLEAGDAILGIGMGSGDHRAMHAAEKAVNSPILETSVEGARSLLLSITGGPDLSLVEASEAARIVQEAAHPDANIIFGANIDEDLDEQVWITVIATRFDSAYARRYRRASRDGEVDRGRDFDGNGHGHVSGVHKVPEIPRVPRPPTSPPTRGELSQADIPEFIPGH